MKVTWSLLVFRFAILKDINQGKAENFAGRKFRLILELSMRNRDIWKTALKKLREKKSWEFSTFLADSREKKLSTNQI